MRSRAIRCAILVPLLVAAAASCAQVPFIGRRQLSLVSSAELNAMSAQQYDEFLKANKVSTDKKQVEMVRLVGVRIQKAVEAYFTDKGQAKLLTGYDWQFNVVASDEVNAWCMPGGRVVVYTGILPVAKTETGLAVVMGHEIAHAIANHGGERMSHAMIVKYGMTALDEAMATQPEQTKELFMSAIGAGAKVGVLLPYSRMQESEADRLGLVFMAMAGYDPREAPLFWERMAALKEGGGPPEFMSTHPSDERRAANLRRLIAEEAMQYYKPAK